MLRKVLLASDVALICVQHALTTDKEEIMGLLLGHGDEDGSVVTVQSLLVLRRLDKKPDRVEISEQQLVQASMRAEELTAELHRPIRVVGWYHSHPHITVWPSHVDLRTQSMYQRMDPSFVGLILAVFLTEQSPQARSLQLTCFQADNTFPDPNRIDVEMQIVNSVDALLPISMETLTTISGILKEEEEETFVKVTSGLVDPDDMLVQEHNAAVRTLARALVIDKVSRPLLETLVSRNALNKKRLKMLQDHHQKLLAEVHQEDDV